MKKKSLSGSMVPKSSLAKPESPMEMDTTTEDSPKLSKKEMKNRKRKIQQQKEKEEEEETGVAQESQEDEDHDQENSGEAKKPKISIKTVKERLGEENRFICNLVKYLRIPKHKNQAGGEGDEDDESDVETGS